MSGDNWEFKVDENNIPDPSKVTKKKKKKKKKKSYPKPPQVKLVTKGKKKKRRDHSGMARRQAALDQYSDEIPPGNGARLKANIIDGLITVAIIAFSIVMSGPFKSFFQGYLHNVAPAKQGTFVMTITMLVLYFVFIVYPSAKFKKSPGKHFCQIRIATPDIDVKPKFFQIIIREALVTPISVLSIVGPGLILINPARRALHDFICGTMVYLDD